jgi:hypothetical protein
MENTKREKTTLQSHLSNVWWYIFHRVQCAFDTDKKFIDILKYKKTVSVVAEHGGSTPLMRKSVTGNVSEQVSFTFYPHNWLSYDPF